MQQQQRKSQISDLIGGINKGPRITNPDQEQAELPPGLIPAEFKINNQGHMRQKIEIGLMTLNGAKFVGTITLQEAKATIYRDTLGFEDFSNFDGVRLAFRGYL